MTRAFDRIATARTAPFVVAGALLLADYFHLAGGLSHVRAGFAYGPWALQRGLYSDVLNLSLDHYLRAGHVIHPLPYVHDRIEYPVLLGFVLWAPSWLPGGPASWLAAAGVLNTAAAFAAIHLVRRLRPTAAWWLAASPALLLDAGINWDLIGIALLVAAVVWFGEERDGWSGAAAAAGVCFKLFPVAMVPAAVAALGARWWRGTGRPLPPAGEGAGGARSEDAGGRLRRWLTPFLAVCAVVLVPFFLANPSNTWWFVRFNDIRPPKDSLWNLLGVWFPGGVTHNGVVNPLSLVAVVASMVYVAWRVVQLPPERQARGVALGTAVVVIVWMAVNKIWNPQYVLWVAAAGALAAMPAGFGVALAAFSVYDWWFEFRLRLPSRPLAFSGVGESVIAVRIVLFALMALWAGWELARLAAPDRADLRPTSAAAVTLR